MKPKMIGAHVPKKPTRRAPRIQICESAEMINRAYNEVFTSKLTHLVYQPTPLGPRT